MPIEIKRLLEAIRGEVAELAAVDIYVAGPQQFQREMREQLQKRGANGGRIFLPQRRNIRIDTAEISGQLKPSR